MREIKFRAWDKQTKQMGRVVSLDFTPMDVHIEIIDEITKKLYRVSRAFPPLMQYTGLKDKNGKEIFEGDIIKFIDIAGGYECMSKVIYGNIGGFTFRGQYYYDAYVDWEDVVIIGNIWENEGLLTK